MSKKILPWSEPGGWSPSTCMLKYMWSIRSSSNNIQILSQRVFAQVIRFYFHGSSKGVLRSHHGIRAKVLANESQHLLTFRRVLGVERVADHFQISAGRETCGQYSRKTPKVCIYVSHVSISLSWQRNPNVAIATETIDFRSRRNTIEPGLNSKEVLI